jgi:hypothetical protein
MKRWFLSTKKWLISVSIIIATALGIYALPSVPCNGLKWNASVGATSYKVYWRTDPTTVYSDANSANVGNVTDILFASKLPVVDTATKTAKHWFVVTALDVDGESQFSNEVSCKKPIESPTGLVRQ